jgi:hypothetical protein
MNASPQPFLLHVMPSLSGVFGSSSSDSGTGAGVAARGVAWAAGRRGAGAGSDSCSDPRLTEVPLGTSGVSTFSGTGVSSTSECFPFVQGSIARNSSKVKTRVLQHFQPGTSCQLQGSVWELWLYGSYPSAPRGRRAGRGGTRIPPLHSHMSCRSPCERTFSPC